MSLQSDLSTYKNKRNTNLFPVRKRTSVRARCFRCGNSLSVVNGHYYCNSCKSFTVKSELNDKPIINK